VTLLQTEEIGKFISIIFAGPPPLLILGFVIFKHDELSLLSLRGGLLALTLAVWIYAWRKHSVFKEMRRTIDQALLQSPEIHAERERSESP